MPSRGCLTPDELISVRNIGLHLLYIVLIALHALHAVLGSESRKCFKNMLWSQSACLDQGSQA